MCIRDRATVVHLGPSSDFVHPPADQRLDSEILLFRVLSLDVFSLHRPIVPNLILFGLIKSRVTPEFRFCGGSASFSVSVIICTKLVF